MIRVFTAEFQQERKAVVRGFTEKGEAVAWARERIADETIAAICLWEMRAEDGRKALAIAAEGKPWYTARQCFLVVVRPGVRKSQ
jgi:hypothetical protein